MTKDEIIKLMRDACDKDKVDALANGFWTITQDELERFAALIAEAEREVCVQIVESEAMAYSEPVWAVEIVNDIRAMSN